MVEMTQRNLHSAKVTFKHGSSASVRARVVLVGRPSLLHAGRMVERLRLTESVSRALAGEHAVLPTDLHRVASNPSMRHVIHVWQAVIHRGETQQRNIKISWVENS